MTEHDSRTPTQKAWGTFEAHVREFQHIDPRDNFVFNSNVQKALEALRDVLKETHA